MTQQSSHAASTGAGTVVTDQAVILFLSPANFFSRGGAFLIDAVVYIFLLLVTFRVYYAIDSFADIDMAALQALMLSTVVGWIVVIPMLVEVLTKGRSLGKLILGLRVVRDDAGVIRARHTVARVLVGFFELWMTFGSVAVLTSIFNARGKRVGDMMAGTYVISVRAPKLPPPTPDVPAEMVPWTKVADVGRIPEALSIEVHRFLRQAPQMTPQARAYHAQRLVTAVNMWVTPVGPPAGVSPEAFLLGAVAERRNRDYETLMKRRESRKTMTNQLQQAASTTARAASARRDQVQQWERAEL